MFPVGSSISHIKPSTICQLVSEAEEQQWRQIEITGEDDTDEHIELGQILLRHGTSVKRINNYFSNLESRKFCLLLTCRKSTFSNVALVGEGQDEDLTRKQSSDEDDKFNELDVTTFQAFQHAYLCATYPVLGVPDLPSPVSPSPINTSSDGDFRKFTYSNSMSTNRTTPYSLQDSGVEDQDETAVIPTETLCELLQRGFKLTPARYRQYEKKIMTNYNKKSAQKLLAEELVGQLTSLENNSNSFYNPHCFLTRNGYDIWQQNERNSVSELLDKFWHFSLPFPTGVQEAGIITYFHQDYCILLHKLLKYETKCKWDASYMEKPLYGLLSSASLRLLREFGLRYGIGEQYRRIVYLKYLTEKFTFNAWFLHHILCILAGIYDMLPSNRSSLVMVREEYLILNECVQCILVQASKALSQMKTLFPNNQPPEGIELLLELISLAHDMKSYLTLERKPVLKHTIYSLIMNIFKPAYEKYKMVAKTELDQKREKSVCPKLLNILINNIRDEIVDYKANFQQTFERFFDITELAAQALYDLLMQDIENYLDFETKNKPMEINLLMLALAYRLNQLDQDFHQYISPECQVWRVFYEGEVVQWSVAFRVHLQDLVLESVSRDKFKMKRLCLDRPLSQMTSGTVSRRSCSISLNSFTPSVNSAFSTITSSVSMRSTPVKKLILDSVLKSESIPEQSSHQVLLLATDSGFKKECQTTFKLDTQSLDSSDNNDNELSCPIIGIRQSSSLPDIIRNTEKMPIRKQLLKDTICKSFQDLGGEESDILFSNRCAKIITPTSEQGVISDEDIVDDDVKIYENIVDDTENVSPVSDTAEFNFPHVSQIEVTHDNNHDFGGDSNSTLSSGGFFSRIYSALFQQTETSTSATSKENLANENTNTSDIANFNDPTDFMESFSSDFSRLTLPDMPNSDVTLPLSGSAIDMMVLLQRNIYFVQMLCDIIYPTLKSDEVSDNSCDAIFILQIQQFMAKQDVYSRFLKTIRETVCMYADNMLCLDLCGTPLSVSKKLIGPQLVEYIQTQQISNLLWGCRHQFDQDRDCLEYSNKQTNYLCDRYEPIKEDMCYRINNVYALSKLLIYYEQQLLCCMNLTGDKLYSEEDQQCNKSGRESHLSLTSKYSMVESVMDGNDEDTEVKSYCIKPTNKRPVLTYNQAHIMSILRGMVKLLTHRLNLFIKDALPLLLELKPSRDPVSTCLQPILLFLSNYFTKLSQWLYKECYRMVQENLWIFIVQNFEIEADKLKREERAVQIKAQNLIQAITCLIKFINNDENGIPKSLLLAQADDVLLQLQLLTLSTRQIITLYLTLTQKNEVHHIPTVPLLSTLLYKLTSELEAKRKCFSGHIVVGWLMYHKTLVQKIDPIYKEGPFHRKIAVNFCQKLLNFQILIDVDMEIQDRSITPSVCSAEYPGVTIFSEYFHDTCASSSDEETTPTPITPETSPVTNSNQVVNKDAEASQFADIDNNTVQSLSNLPQIVCGADNHVTLNNVSQYTSTKERISVEDQEICSLNEDFNDSLTSVKYQPITDEYYRELSINSAESTLCDEDSRHHKNVKDNIDKNNSKKTIKLPLFDHVLTTDSSASRTSSLSTSSNKSIQFYDSKTHFYRIDESYNYGSQHFFPVNQDIFGNSGTFKVDSSETVSLAEKCFHKKISPLFLLVILYGRRKIDNSAKSIIRQLPGHILDKVKNYKDAPSNNM